MAENKTRKTGVYINKLADVDQEVLAELVGRSFTHMRQRQC